MSLTDPRPPWSPILAPPQDHSGQVQQAKAAPSDAAELSEAEYCVVAELRDRVSTRLTAEDKNYATGPRRELTKKLIRDEYDSWLLHEANRGRTAPAVTTEDR
ncbi:MAG: putative Flp pilus assembly protein ATPase CpaF, partial [Blastococcus sp.]|nr:putative Flp pilus assembly protein ATPase CpaF [Blastococcus sp.]